MSPYSRTDGTPYGILKVIGESSIALSSDLELLYAGSNRFPWAAEAKTISTEVTAKVKAYPDFLFELFLGASATASGADTSGTITTAANKNGATIIDATTGLASVTIKAASKANLKFGKYVLEATTEDDLNIYLLSDIDFKRGTDVSYTDDTLLVATVAIADSGGTTDVDSLGLTFTGGSGTVAFTVGHTATFEVKPPSTTSSTIVVGAAGDSSVDFGALMYAQKRATDEIFEVDAHYCVGVGLPISFAEQAYSEAELKMQCLYDSALDRVFTIRHIDM